MHTQRRAAVLGPARQCTLQPPSQGRAPVPGSSSRSRVVTRTARPTDLPAVLALVRQHRADAHAEDVLTGHTRLNAAASGFRRLLEDPAHRVVLAVLPGPNAAGADGGEKRPSGSRCSGSIRSPWCSATRRSPSTRSSSTASTGVAARERCCWPRPRPTPTRRTPRTSSASVGGHEAERQRFFARMGFAPLTTRRIVTRETLLRSLTAWQRGGCPSRCCAGPRGVAARSPGRCPRSRRWPPRGERQPVRSGSVMVVSRPVAVGRPCSSVIWMRKVDRVRPVRMGVQTAVTTPDVALRR